MLHPDRTASAEHTGSKFVSWVRFPAVFACSMVLSCAMFGANSRGDEPVVSGEDMAEQGKTNSNNTSGQDLDLSVAKPAEMVLSSGTVEGRAGIYVKTVPPGAKVQVDGALQHGKSPLVVEGLPAGRHYVFAYTDESGAGKEVLVEPDTFSKLTLKLSPLGGRALILSTPAEADVEMDGKPVGTTPLVLRRLSPGEHGFVLTKHGFAADRFKAVFKGSEIQRFERKLLKAGRLVINADIEGPQVKLDGVPVGKLPLDLQDVAEGKYTAEITSGPFSGQKLAVQVKAGQVSTYDWELSHKKCKIEIKVEPENAKLFLDGKEKGKGPSLQLELPCGKHTIEAKHWRFLPGKAEVVLSAGKTAEISLALKTGPGTLKIDSKPEGGIVTVNGKIQAGKTPLILDEVPAGTYELEISLQGYMTVTRTVLVKPNKTTTVSVNFTREE